MPGSIDHSLAEQAREREAQRPRVPRNTIVHPITQEQAEGAARHGNRYSTAQRVQALTLLSLGVYKIEDIERWLQIPKRTLQRILKKAKERGYRPQEDPRILEHHVIDGASANRGRP